MMAAWVFMVPVIWAFALWVLSRLEERTLAPEERADTINALLRDASPEEIERRVSEFLSNSIADRDRARERVVGERPRRRFGAWLPRRVRRAPRPERRMLPARITGLLHRRAGSPTRASAAASSGASSRTGANAPGTGSKA